MFFKYPSLTRWRCVQILSSQFKYVNTWTNYGKTASLQRTGIADVSGMQSGRSKTTRHVICQDTHVAVLCKPPHRMSSTIRQWSKPARLKHIYNCTVCIYIIYVSMMYLYCNIYIYIYCMYIYTSGERVWSRQCFCWLECAQCVYSWTRTLLGGLWNVHNFCETCTTAGKRAQHLWHVHDISDTCTNVHNTSETCTYRILENTGWGRWNTLYPYCIIYYHIHIIYDINQYNYILYNIMSVSHGFS